LLSQRAIQQPLCLESFPAQIEGEELVSGRRLYGGRGHVREKPAGSAMASRREPLTQSARNLVPIPHPQRALTAETDDDERRAREAHGDRSAKPG
jgi:hypothetical protein